MTALMLVALLALTLMLFGALIGAEIQDKLHEAHRRRMARRLEQAQARTYVLDDDGRSFELAWPTRQLAVPLAIRADDPG